MMRRAAGMVVVMFGIAVVVATFVVNGPSEICRGHHPFPDDALDQYGFLVAEQHFTRVRGPVVAAHCTLEIINGPQTAPTAFVVNWPATGLAFTGVALAVVGIWFWWSARARRTDPAS